MSDELKALKTELAELAATFKVPARLEFAKGLAAGKSQEQAYKDAGYKSKKPAVDASKAISAYPTIAQYKNLFLKIAQLESLPRQIGTLEQKRNMLWDIARRSSVLKAALKGSGDEDGEGALEVFDATAAKTAVAAIAELNKMDGHLASIKADSKVTSTIGFRLNLAGNSRGNEE